MSVFEGRWTEDEHIATISENAITTQQGSFPIFRKYANKIAVEFHGKVFEAELVSDKLIWSFGKVWTRMKVAAIFMVLCTFMIGVGLAAGYAGVPMGGRLCDAWHAFQDPAKRPGKK